MADVEKYGISPAITVIAFIEHFVSDMLHQCVLMWNDYSVMSLCKRLQMDYLIGKKRREMQRCMDSEPFNYRDLRYPSIRN